MWELETLKACQAYDFDGVIDAATARIAKAAGLGKDYKSPNVSQRDVICVLNYLDGLAIGIEQKLYIEQIVRDHLGPVIDHAVTNFLDTAVVERHYYPHLTNVHGRWFRGAQSPNYKAPAPK